MLLSIAPALLGAAGAAALARAHGRRVEGCLSPELPRLIEALRRGPLEDRVAKLGELATPFTWEGELASELARAGPGEARAAALDDALADLEGQLRGVRGWSEAALRIAILGGLLGASAGAIVAGWVEALAALTLGVLGAGFSAAFGRRARALEAAQRRRADELVALLAGGRAGGLNREDLNPERERRSKRAPRHPRRGLDRNDPAG